MLLDEKQSVYKIALLSKDIIDLAERGNDVALSIIQEATRNIGDYIINLLDKLTYISLYHPFRITEFIKIGEIF